MTASRSHARAAAWLLACASVVSGCGSAATPGADAGDAGSQPDTADASRSDGASPDASDDAPASAAFHGTIRMTQSASTAGSQYTVEAEFAREGTGVSGGRCTSSAIEGCVVTVCTQGASDPMPASFPHDGVVTVAGGALAAPITLMPQDNGLYPLQGGRDDGGQMAVLWTQGQSLTVRSTGMAGGGPALDQRVVPPAATVVVTQPADDPTSDHFTVDRGRDYAIAWTVPTGAPADLLVLAEFMGEAASPDGATTTTTTVRCTQRASASAMTVPAAALTQVAPMAIGALEIDTVATTTVTANDWTVDLEARAVGQVAGAPDHVAAGPVQFGN